MLHLQCLLATYTLVNSLTTTSLIRPTLVEEVEREKGREREGEEGVACKLYYIFLYKAFKGIVFIYIYK